MRPVNRFTHGVGGTVCFAFQLYAHTVGSRTLLVTFFCFSQQVVDCVHYLQAFDLSNVSKLPEL